MEYTEYILKEGVDFRMVTNTQLDIAMEFLSKSKDAVSEVVDNIFDIWENNYPRLTDEEARKAKHEMDTLEKIEYEIDLLKNKILQVKGVE